MGQRKLVQLSTYLVLNFKIHIYMCILQEMNLLIEAEQPGNQVDDYVSNLNSILSQKAAGILKLQSQLANFKQRLNEHNVLVSSARY